LQQVVEVAAKLTGQVVFHPLTIVRDEKRLLCFCKKKSSSNMGFCDGCNQWYHFACLGLTVKDLERAADWRCGYCRAKPDNDGMCEWKMTIPKGPGKRAKVAPKRHFRDTPAARGAGPETVEMVQVGPVTWDDTVAEAKKGGKTINGKMLAFKKRAEKLVQEGGHHIVDEMGAAGLQARSVDQVLVNDLIQENLLRDEVEPEAEIEEEDDSG